MSTLDCGRTRASRSRQPSTASSTPSYFGTMLVHARLADGMVSGCVTTTAHTIRPALEIVRTAPGVSVVSSVFLMCLADRVLVYGDCAVNPDPTAEQLADIAVSSARTAQQFGIDAPRRDALVLDRRVGHRSRRRQGAVGPPPSLRERAPDLLVDGPVQYDAAVDPAVARTKLPDSPVAGRATVLIFPDLNTGNNTYKAVQRSAQAVAIGPVLQGLNRPVNDLSRGAHVRDIVNTVAITAVQAGFGVSTASGTASGRNPFAEAAGWVHTAARGHVLVVNAGSSSLKYRVVDAASGRTAADRHRLGDRRRGAPAPRGR